MDQDTSSLPCTNQKKSHFVVIYLANQKREKSNNNGKVTIGENTPRTGNWVFFKT